MSRFKLPPRIPDRTAKIDPPGALEDHDSGPSLVATYPATVSDPPRESGPSSRAVEATDFDRLGDHVSSVLSAAQEAALRIREEARKEAETLREQAQQEAMACAEEAREEADASTAEALRLRSDARQWAEQARTAAENYAADRQSGAEAEAQQILSAAERQASSYSDDAQRRHQALKMDISLAEDHLRELASGLHDLAVRLDNLLSTHPGEEESDRPAADDDSLIDALGPQHAQNEESAT